MSKLGHSDLVICTTANGERLAGVVLHVFANGRLLVDVGTGKADKHGDPNRDVRAFDAERVRMA